MADPRHISELRAALEAEHRAITHARTARHHLDSLIARAVAAGLAYDNIARIALKLRLGRAPTAQERQREADRLRQRRRRSVTGRHGNLAEPWLKMTRARVGSSVEVNNMAERLIRRKIVEEEYKIEDHKKDEAECADDTEAAADEGDEDEDEEEEDEEGDED